MLNKILLALLFSFSIKSAFAQDIFPMNFDAEVKQKNYGVNFFYSENFMTTDIDKASYEFRLEAKALFFNNNGSGLQTEIAYQHLPWQNPATLSDLIPQGNAAYMQDFSTLLGYKFNFDSFSLLPFVKPRVIVTRGQGGDNFYGSEFGGDIAWKIYPETTTLNLRYGYMIPFLHRYTGQADKITLFSLAMHNIEARLTYRIFKDVDLITAYNMRQIPRGLGTSGFTANDKFLWHGIMFGLGYNY